MELILSQRGVSRATEYRLPLSTLAGLAVAMPLFVWLCVLAGRRAETDPQRLYEG